MFDYFGSVNKNENVNQIEIKYNKKILKLMSKIFK